MAHKGETYKQQPTLWHIGLGLPCRVMRRRCVVSEKTGKRVWRWVNCEHAALTEASARRWWRLAKVGKAIIRRDVNLEVAIGFGIVPRPPTQEWAKSLQPSANKQEPIS